MDFMGKKQPKCGSKKSAGDFKVVYISTPMKVKTSASKFRSLVQKLTGQDSDAETFMELIAAADRSSRQSSAAFLDRNQLPGDDGDRRFVEPAAAPAEDLGLLQNFEGSFEELYRGFVHESEVPGFSSLL